MHSLSCYRNIEDPKRKDKDEGEGRIDYVMEDRPKIWISKEPGQILSQGVEPGPVHFHTQSINPCYILCFHGPEVNLEYLAGQNRPYVVRLNKPDILVCDIASYLERCYGMPDKVWVKCVRVSYDKDELARRLPEPASEERLKMSYGQKAPKFCLDCEYRIVLTLPVTTPNPPAEIKVELKKRLEYAEIVQLPDNNQKAQAF